MNYLKQSFFTLIGSIIGSFLTIMIIVKIYGGDISGLIPDATHLLSPDTKLDKLTNIDKLKLERLIDKNIVFSADDLLGQIGTFYSTIIVFLVAIITVMSIFTLFFVKASAEEKAEEKAKDVAKQVVLDKIDPKIQLIDERLAQFNESELDTKIQSLLQYKVLDSIHFWSKIEESVYSVTDDVLDDYEIASIQDSIQKNSNDIKNITSTVQIINTYLDGLTSTDSNDEVISIDEAGNNGNDEVISIDEAGNNGNSN